MGDLPEPHKQVLQLASEEQLGLWFSLGPIEDFYRGDTPQAIQSRALQVLYELMRDGLIEPGVPTSDGSGFIPWKESPDVAIKRIKREWDALGREPSIGDIVWFSATRAGRKLLAEVGARKYP